MLATVVDTKALWQTIVAAIVAGVGVTLIFSLAIFGAARFAEHSRSGHAVAAALSGALAILCVLATVAAIAIGVIVMTSK
jgi:hypothetical protein